MERVNWIWMNGEIVEWDKAVIHVMSPSLHYGVSVFEGIRAYWNGSKWLIFRLKDHIKRLYYSAKVYRLKIKYEMNNLINAIIEVIRKNNVESHIYIRPIIFRSLIDRKPSLRKSIEAPASIAIAIRTVKSILEDKEEFEKPRRYMISSWRRPSPNSLPMYVKCSANYANSALAMIEARESGFDGAIMLDHKGYISESTGANLFMIKNEKLITPPLSASILPGITRDTIIKLASDLNLEVVEKDICRAELYSADEVFICGTMAEVTPITQVDGIIYNDGKPGPITRKIAEYYYEVVMNKVPKYSDWITIVEKGS